MARRTRGSHWVWPNLARTLPRPSTTVSSWWGDTLLEGGGGAWERFITTASRETAKSPSRRRSSGSARVRCWETTARRRCWPSCTAAASELVREMEKEADLALRIAAPLLGHLTVAGVTKPDALVEEEIGK